jgi:hypothetical protein
MLVPLKTYKVKEYWCPDVFEDGLNEMAAAGFVLDNWKECGNHDTWNIVAVFVSDGEKR